LEKIRSNHRDIDRCMTDMLASWLQGQTTPSWKALVDGLASQSMNEKDVATKVAMKHDMSQESAQSCQEVTHSEVNDTVLGKP